MFFELLDDAMYYLNIADNTTCLAIHQCAESYERFTQGGRILFCIGQGYKRSYGHPSGNQHLGQQKLLTGNHRQQQYPVFKIFSNCVEYMGNYTLITYKKAISFEGFVYFEYKLVRVSMCKLRLDVIKETICDTTCDTTCDTRCDTTCDPICDSSIESLTQPNPVAIQSYWLPSCTVKY